MRERRATRPAAGRTLRPASSRTKLEEWAAGHGCRGKWTLNRMVSQAAQAFAMGRAPSRRPCLAVREPPDDEHAHRPAADAHRHRDGLHAQVRARQNCRRDYRDRPDATAADYSDMPRRDQESTQSNTRHNQSHFARTLLPDRKLDAT